MSGITKNSCGQLLITCWMGLILLLCFSCGADRETTPAFYYWKTGYRLDKVEQAYVDRLKVRKLYVRIMDIDMDDSRTHAIPISPIRFQDSAPDSIVLVPVVYIVNNVFNLIDSASIKVLAEKVVPYVGVKLRQAGKSGFHALQIDCDWTASTRDKYFYFLECLQSQTLFQGKKLSVTLRLHQVRNKSASGIPPVEKVLLMCYNMGNLRKPGDHNSIFDMKEMEIYLRDHLRGYPLHVDVALPLFEWGVAFRHDRYIGLTTRISPTDFADRDIFGHEGKMLYRLKKDFPAAGLRQGDVVRHEKISSEDLFSASKFLSRYLGDDSLEVIFYHLDAKTLENFRYEDLQKAIDYF